MTDEPRSRTFELGTGLRYHALEWGDVGLGHTVVLIHGFLDLAWGWLPVARSGLAERFHVIAPDMRGHGDSDRVGAGGYYHFFDYVADLDELIHQTGASRVSLVGHSMGGSIAGYFAGTFPERLHRLALLEGVGPPESPTPVPERVHRWVNGWRSARERAPRTYPDLTAAAARLRKHDPLLSEALADELALRGTREFAGGRVFKHDPLHLTLGPYPFQVDVASQFWSRIRCPVLLVEGAQSSFRLSRAEAERRHACFADRDCITLEGAGHMMQRHVPEALAAVLQDFLGD